MKAKIVIASAMIATALLASTVFAQGNKPSSNPGLSSGALRACQSKESAIKTRMESLSDLATNIEKVFDSIATRVEGFYTSKVLPSGKTVNNYNILVADISTKKGVVDTDLASAQTLVNSFSCSSGNPKTLLTQFRLDMQKVKQDLGGFRTSIKNLIVAVKGVAPTPEPSATP